MSARLVSNLDRAENGERLPMSAERAETLANVTQFAESLERLLLRDSRDGQLWERVAELAATGLNYTERMERVKFDRIVSAAGRLSRESESRHFMRGPDAKYAPAHRSGVIESGTRRPNNVRAGERVK